MLYFLDPSQHWAEELLDHTIRLAGGKSKSIQVLRELKLEDSLTNLQQHNWNN